MPHPRTGRSAKMKITVLPKTQLSSKVELDLQSLTLRLAGPVLANASEEVPSAALNLTVGNKAAPVALRVLKAGDQARVAYPDITVTTHRDGSETIVYDYGDGTKTSITTRKDTSKTIVTEINDGKGHKTKPT
jgi:hypothetical protein